MVNSGDDTERLRRGIFIEIAPSALLPRNDGILNVIPRSSWGRHKAREF